VNANLARCEPAPRQRICMEPDTVERDLVRLVLTIVELLRQISTSDPLVPSFRVDEPRT